MGRRPDVRGPAALAEAAETVALGRAGPVASIPPGSRAPAGGAGPIAREEGVSKLSKQVENRLIVSGKVVASARAHGGEVAKALAARAEAALGAGKAPTASEFEGVIGALAATLEAAAGSMKVAELAYTAEQADDAAPRAQREKAAAEGFALMVKVRALVESALGDEGLRTYGLTGETPRPARALSSHLENVLSLLAKRPASVATELGTAFDSSAVAAAIGPKQGALSAALKDVDREARELEEALGKRDMAIEAWVDAYQGTATAFEGMCRAAGRRDLAERVRPTSRRVSGEDAGEEGGGSGGGPPPGGAGTP